MNFKSRKEYQEHVEWCTGEMHLWLNNDEPMYKDLQRILAKPWTMRRKASYLRYHYGNFDNGDHNVGRYTRFTDIVKEELANMELDKA